MDAISRRLMRAYNRLQNINHWTKGQLERRTYFDGDDGETITQHCLLGAVGVTDSGDRVRPYSCRHFLIEAILELFPSRIKSSVKNPNCPALFNDHRSTKHADVLAVLRRSIELSEAHFTQKNSPQPQPTILVVVKSPWSRAA